MASPVRVRYAPSPTGYLHLGSVRTALFNWLWARHTGGTFILRVEDTDLERSTEASVQAIFDAMRWLELDWDEGPEVGGPNGPYFQTQRTEIYREFAERLIQKGRAYRCYCTKEDLAKARAEHKARTGSEQGFRYPGTCRNRSAEPDKEYVVRLRTPESGVTGWNDLIKGPIAFDNSSQQDAVLLRHNGLPLYNMGAAVDDITMGVTLVARGDDHTINTPQQILIYEALGEPVPQFAHMPLILAPNGEKLSKRHAAVSVSDYRDLGYLPDGVLNYLVRLGWSHGDQEIFTRPELIEKFGWDHVGNTGAKYDLKKFQYVQANQLRLRDAATLARLVRPFLERRGLPLPSDASKFETAVALVTPRAGTLAELADGLDYFLRDVPEPDPKAWAKFIVAAQTPRLEGLRAVLADAEPFEAAVLEAKVKVWLDAEQVELKDVAQPARVALTGRSNSPGLFEVIAVLGKARCLARLDAAIAAAKAG
jgi:glutamyl-tRNA synthetase